MAELKPPGGGRGGRWPVSQVVAVLLAGALAFAAVAAVVEWRRADSLDHDAAARDSVATAAAAEGRALFTYDYRDLGAAQQRILAGAGGAFRQQEAAHNQSVEANLAKAQATGTATAEDVSVSEQAGGRAQAFVILHSHGQATSGSTDGIQYLNMTLALQRGRWKVDAVQSLAAPPG